MSAFVLYENHFKNLKFIITYSRRADHIDSIFQAIESIIDNFHKKTRSPAGSMVYRLPKFPKEIWNF